MSKKFSYYSFNAILSRNAVINMVMGARGLGKTYGAKKYAINQWVRHGKQFIYLRRYKSELKGRDSFFSDIAHEWPGHEFRVNGNVAQGRLCDDENWQTMGYFIALSTSQSNKSVAYPMVTTIIFDEFIIEKGSVHYLPNEVKRLYDFYSTVDRWQDKTRVLMLSNAISIVNPYFREYGFEPDSEFKTYGKGFVCAHFVDSSRFASEVAHTRFGSFIIDHSEEYADYSIGNTFADSNDDYVLNKTGTARYEFTMRTKQGVFSIWIDGRTWFAQVKRPKSERLFAVGVKSLREGEVLLPFSNPICSQMRTAYRHGRMFFDSASTRNAFSEVFS